MRIRIHNPASYSHDLSHDRMFTCTAALSNGMSDLRVIIFYHVSHPAKSYKCTTYVPHPGCKWVTYRGLTGQQIKIGCIQLCSLPKSTSATCI
jgi:hypothetical protein